LRDDIDGLAGLFHARGDFSTIFINLVPWDELVGPPNNGHAAIADLLVSRGACAALSANFDPLIEYWAGHRRINMRGALNGQEAVSITETHPLLKFHGCLVRAKESTLWTKSQLADPGIQARIQSFTQWINLHLPGKHLVVVGFWTDWPHLNDALADAFTVSRAQAVTVIDPLSREGLQAKAPNLWTRLTSLSQSFEHVQESGADALEELRKSYSKAWARKFYALGQVLMVGTGLPPNLPSLDSLSGDELYSFRQNAEGKPHDKAATLREPAPAAASAAALCLRLLEAGASHDGALFRHSGKSIRVVNGAGLGMAQVMQQFVEPPSIVPDIVVCTAEDFGGPGRVIASGQGASTVRPAHGGTSKWMTIDEAIAEFGI
jgi:hypothetical protein